MTDPAYREAVSTPGPLSSELRHLAATCALAAVGDGLASETGCRAALSDGVRAASLREAFLQSYLFLGYPRAIEALGALNRALVSLGREETEGIPPESPPLDTAAVRTAGEELCRWIYGPVYEPLRRKVARLHPLLDRWMVEEGYGRVLSRPELSPREREFGVLPALVVLRAEPQLESHLRGALRVGATPAELEQIVGIAARLAGEPAAEIARRTLARVLGREP
ncbi:MAG: carboxymuconolactone decarboxylase family protein [Planctomycetes bacterium]|nr:carboxymuconolactone decarboxylase family protein [Planctomycetota bacterium]